MNKIFRIVWSYATQSWVVVSELTKAHKKQSSSNSLKAALGAATVLLSINSAEAAVLIGSADGTTIQPHGSTVSDWGITIGGAVTKTGGQSVHIGDATGSVGTRNVVIGTYASAGYDDKNSANNPPKDGAFNQSVAIGAGKAPGEGARAYGDQSIAIGSNTIARGNSSIAIGNDDVDKTETIDTTYTDLEGNRTTATIGTAYNKLTGKNLKWDGGQYADTTAGEAAVAIGVKAEAGDISLALGTAAKAKVVNGVAIGSGATATRDNAVAIGGGSTTEVAATSEKSTTVNGLTFNWAGGERTIAGDVVSFGKDQYERQLKHVSPGAVTATSTDAINGSQLYGVLNHLTSDPVYLYGADDSSADKVAGDDAEKKSADAKTKKIVARSMADSRLNLKGGATGELTDNNIGVKYEDEGTIRFKLAKALTGLTSAEFKDANNNVVNITPTGVSFTKPNANTVTVNQDGLNNGGNVITNVAGNLEGAKPNSTAPTTSATAPNNVDGIKNNAATVGDVLQAGWNLQNNGTAKDFVKPYDTVNFADGNGTTAVVETTENKTSTVKYNVNLGNGLEKNSANEITIKPADKSLEVTTAGLKAKTDGTTITTDPTNGLKVVTGGIEAGTKPGTVKVTDGDNDKIATVDSVVNAVNSAAFTLKASAIEGGTRNTGSTVTATGESIKAGSTIEMIAGKNLDVKHDKNGKITFATVDNPSFSTVQVGDNEGPKFSATADGNIKVSDKDDANPVKITNVKDGEISKTSKDAINGSQFHKLANNTIQLKGQTGDKTATETKKQELNKENGITFTVKSSNGDLLEVTAAEDTITLTPKTATLTTTDGVPTADTTNGKLVTADQLVTALTEMGWKATADKEGTGTVEDSAEELIKAGSKVTFKAGNNLAVKQAGKDFIYSLKTELTGLTSAEFKNAAGDITSISPTGVTITPVAADKKPVTLTTTGLNNGGNPITNVTSGLANHTEVGKHELRNLTNTAVPDTTAATVGDLRNMGWVVSSNKTTGDLSKPYSEAVKNTDEVKFVGTGLATVSGKTENGVRTITVDVESKTAINAVTYTKLDGTPVYPVEGPTGTTYHTTPEGKGPNDETVNGSNVITSVNGPKGTKTPSTLSNVAGNLEGAKPNSIAPTTSATAPNNVDGIKNNAATVGDVLQAGWNLQNNGAEKDFVKPYDTVNFADGNGTTAVVDTTENKTSTVKYNVNLGNGLDKTTDNKITVKPADSSLVVDAAGVKVNTGTVNTVETGDKKGTVEVPTADAGKIATVDTVAKAVNSASFTLKASATTDGTRNGNSTVNANGESIKAGSTIEMIAGKNLDVKHDKNGKITFATVDNPSFSTVQVGDNEGPKFSATADGNIKVSDKDDANPVKITNVKDGEISKTSKDAINGSQFHKLANNTIKLAGQNGEEEATETDPQNLNQKDGIKFTVKSSDGKLLEVTAGGDTITITPKTGTITTTNGVPTATTTNGKLVTADEVVKALTEMGWKATADQEGTGTVEGKAEELIKAGNTVTFKAGNNLAVKQAGKEFIYSLNPALTGLTSAEFKGTAENAPTTKLTNEGVTITPVTTGKSLVSLTENGLNNGGNAITNVAGNLDGAKTGTAVPTTSATKPTLGTAANEVNSNNAATVGDVLNAGWNLQGNNEAKDFVTAYDTVNFVDGYGTSVSVTNTDNKTSTIKYSVNTGNGLQKDPTGNTISVKPADKSLEVTNNGVKVKAADNTLTTDANGLKVNTGEIEPVTTGTNPGAVKVKDNDAGKIATVDSVVKAVNDAAFTLKASAGDGTRNGNSTVNANGESIKAGSTIEMIAGKNLNVTHNTNGKITFATVENPSFNTVQVGNSEGPKFSATADGNIKVSDKDDTKPVKITNVADGTISDSSKDAINGSQIHKLVNKAIKLAGQNGSDASGETDPQNLTQQDPIKFTVKSSDGTLLHVAAAGDTITLTPKTGTITTGADGIPTVNTTGGKLVTADNLVKALTEMGWKATADKEGSGTVEGNAEELIKAGETVTFKAGNNLAVKQAGKNFIYSLNPALTGLTSAEFKDGDNKVKITPTGITITKPADPTAGTPENTVTLNQNGLNNGGNPITNVTSGLANHTEVGKHELRNLTNTAVPDTTAATVGDLRNMGWVVSSNKTTGDLSKPYSEAVKNTDEVKFVGTGLATVSGKTENGVRTITVDVESKTAINAVTYTKPDGTKVYPVEGPTGITYHTTPEGKGPNDETVGESDVITSVNGPKGTQIPSTLSNVAGNLDGAKAGTDAPTTKHDAPNTTEATGPNYVNPNNAATVGDVLQAGWNLQNNGTEKDFVKPYDTVNFVDGNGTTAVVDTTENKTSTVKYNVNLGNGLDKTTDNKITVKPADSSLVVDAAGVKVNTGTINTTATGTAEPKANDENKVATVGNVVSAINNAAFTLKASATAEGTRNASSTIAEAGESIKAGNTVELVAGKNLDVKHEANGKITFATKDNVTFETVQVGDAQGPKLSKTDDGDLKVSGPNGTEPVKITNVEAGDISETSKDAINGSQFHKLAKNTIKLAGKNGDEAATETNTQTLDKENGIAFTVKSSDGKLLEVTAQGDTITLTPKVGSVTTDANGVPTADVTNGKLVTAEELVTALKGMGWKATAGKDGTGTVDGNTEELIKAGETVTFKAGNNLAVKQAGKDFIYSLKTELTGLTSAEFKNAAGDKTVINGDGVTITPVAEGKKPVSLTKDGLNNGGNPITNVISGLTNYTEADKHGLRNLTNANVLDTTAATVGDLRNMGWVVSSNKTTGALGNPYSEAVKNANEVKFVGEGSAIVSGKTDANGVRTITVKVDDQTSTNNSVTPIVYTKADGTQVYPTNKKDDQGHPIFNTKADGSGDEVPGTDVVTSVNGPNGTKGDKAPTTLKNVKNNIPNVNDGAKTITNPDGTEKAGDVENINKAPLTAAQAAELSNPKTADGAANPKYIGNNAATVSDVLNAGWNLQNNGTAKDFVKPYDTVNFINGLGTTAVVTTREGSTTSDVTFNVKAANGSVTVDEDGVKVTTGEMKPTVDANNKETGAIATPVDPTRAKQLKDTLDAAVKELATAKDALKAAETELAAKPNDPALKQAVEDKKAQVAAKQTPVNDAQKAHDDAGLNKVATVQNVAEAINNAGFNLKTSADGGEKLTTGSKNDGELIKPGNTVEMVAGNNLTVKQDEHGKITYATKDDVTFKTVDTGTLTVGNPNTYTDGKGNTYTKVGENYYKPADLENGVPKQDATPVDVTTTPVTQVSPVTMKTEAAKPPMNNATDAQPSSALNVTSKDGKPTQITGVGSTLNTNVVKTTPEGTTAKPGSAPGTTPKTEDVHLVDLKGTDAAPVNKNAAATVGDLQNMGWVVSTKDGNGYKDVVKNANVVDFKGENGIRVTGTTLEDGTRQLTVGIKEGEVTNKVTITHADGTKTDAVKIGDNYYKVDDNGKPVGYEKGNDGKPAGTPLTINPTEDKVTNNGAGVVTGNAVANAIQDSGWNVGIGSTDKDFSKDAKVYDKVNPNDDVKFANGANTNVSMVTVDALNEDGTKKATTFVKVDINRDLKIDSVTTGGTATDKNGNNLVKVGDQYYKEGDVTVVTNPDGTKTVTPKENAKAVPPADVIPAKDGAMIVKNADGKDVVSATVGKDGNGAFGINGKDGKNGISMTAKDGQGTIGVNGKDGKSTTIAGDTITIKDKDNNATNIGVNTITLVDKAGNTTTTTADKSEIKDAAGNMNTSTPTTNVLKDTNGNTNASTATGTTYTDKDKNTTTVGPKEIALSDKDGNNTSKLTNNDLLLNTKDPNTGVEKTSHMSGDKISFNTTDEIEKGPDGKPVIDPKTNNPKVKNPGNSTEYTNEGLKVIPNSTVARDVNGNPTFLDKDGKPVMKDKDGSYKYMGQDGKPGANYTGAVGSLKSNVVDNTRVISFGMDKPVLDSNGKPVMAPDGKPVMTEGISAGMQRVHNVAPGRISPTSTDAVNGSQLYAVASNIGNLNNKINKVGKRADAGTASALAAATIPQAYTPGKSLVGIAAGSYQGQNGLAVGMSRISDNGKIIIRLSGTANTQGKTGVAAGVGYQW